MNVGEQRDTSEYVGTLFDRLESQVKDTPFKNIIKEVFGGTTYKENVCQNCGHVVATDQDFLTIQIEVRNLSNIQDSFQNFIRSE